MSLTLSHSADENVLVPRHKQHLMSAGSSFSVHPHKICQAVRVVTWDWAEINWAAETVKFFSTLGGVGIGAYGAYYFASRGRREDLFIKERFKAAENIVGFLLSIDYRLILSDNVLLGITAAGDEKTKHMTDAQFQGYREAKAIENISFVMTDDYRRFELLLSPKSLAEYRSVMGEIIPTLIDVRTYVDLVGINVEFAKQPNKSRIQKKIRGCREKIKELVSQIIREQNLPGLSPDFYEFTS